MTTRQLVTQIVQNINVVFEKRYPGLSIEQLEKEAYEEVSIYWAARLMEVKLESALFLLFPERIQSNISRFRFHGLATKYLKIYARSFEAKNVKLETHGDSYGLVEGNSEAVQVMLHALLDNALKYCPRGSTVTVEFDEADADITFRVTSLGPRIERHERDKIYDPFYRGEAARKRESEGTGFGLAVAQVVARAMGSAIGFQQKGEQATQGLYWTTFAFTLAKSDGVGPKRADRSLLRGPRPA